MLRYLLTLWCLATVISGKEAEDTTNKELEQSFQQLIGLFLQVKGLNSEEGKDPPLVFVESLSVPEVTSSLGTSGHLPFIIMGFVTEPTDVEWTITSDPITAPKTFCRLPYGNTNTNVINVGPVTNGTTPLLAFQCIRISGSTPFTYEYI